MASRRLTSVASASAMLVVVALVGLVYAGVALARAHAAALAELQETTRLQRRLDEVLQRLVDGETAQRGFLLSNDEQFLGPFEDSRTLWPVALAEAETLLERRGEGELAARLGEAVRVRSAFTDETVALARSGEADEARRRVVGGEGRVLMDAVRALLAEAHELDRDADLAAVASVEASRARFEGVFLGLVALSVVMAFVLAALVGRELARARDVARHSERGRRRLQLLADSARDLIRIHRLDGTSEYVSPSATALLGYTPDEMAAMPPGVLVPEPERARLRAILAEAIAAREAPPPLRHGFVHRDGSVRAFESTIGFLDEESGDVAAYFTVARDVTDQISEAARLSAIASHDELTGLLNRRALLERGAELLGRCDATGRSALCFFADVNGLKTINDELGHDAGDAVIRDVGKLLAATARDTDLVARLGGDEFVVLGSVSSTAGADALADRLGERIALHNASADRPYRVSVSIGSDVFEPKSGATVEVLLAGADAAMYEKKRSRRGGATTASGEMIVRKPPSGPSS